MGVFALESVGLWPVWGSSFSASSGVGFSAGWLAVFLLSVGAGDWGVINELGRCWLKGLWLNASSGVGSVADLDGWLLVVFEEGLGVWSGFWVSHVVWIDASLSCVSSIANNDWLAGFAILVEGVSDLSWLTSLSLENGVSAHGTDIFWLVHAIALWEW